MLRCPKCSCVYQDKTQKFCTQDGARIVDLAVELMPNHQSPRLTPPGELLSETFVSPSDNPFVEGSVPSNRVSALSFQSFGLHSSNTSGALRGGAGAGAKATNGFHSFDSLVVDDKEKKTSKTKFDVNSEDSPSKHFDVAAGSSGENQRFGAPFIIVCLLGALLLLTGLAFAATYFFGENGLAPAPEPRETSCASGSARPKGESVVFTFVTNSRDKNFLKLN